MNNKTPQYHILMPPLPKQKYIYTKKRMKLDSNFNNSLCVLKSPNWHSFYVFCKILIFLSLTGLLCNYRKSVRLLFFACSLTVFFRCLNYSLSATQVYKLFSTMLKLTRCHFGDYTSRLSFSRLFFCTPSWVILGSTRLLVGGAYFTLADFFGGELLNF